MKFGGLGDFMKQAQVLQTKMQQAQQEIKLLEVEGNAGAGLIKATLAGDHSAKRIKIDPSLVPGLSESDREVLEDLIVAAYNDANNKVEETSKKKLAGLTAGLNLPAGFEGLG